MTETVYTRTVLTGAAAESSVSVRYRRGGGEFVDTTLRRLPIEEVLAGTPVREFRAWRGRRHYSGWYWSSTTGGHVVYESRLELARILLADHDPDVAAIAAQPFQLTGEDQGRLRRHIPDLLLSHRNAALTVVDVKAAARLDDPAVRAQFAWTERVCAAHGLGFEVWSGGEHTLLENVRFLAGYRRPSTACGELEPAVMSAAVEPTPIALLERELAASSPAHLVRPAILNLLWRSRLRTDLSQPLGGGTVVVAGAAA